MRKLILFLLTLGIVGLSHAGVFGSREKSNLTLRYSITANTASTSTILIDLSDTTNYPHKRTTSIDISHINISLDKASTSSGTLKIGVITAISATNADVSFFSGIDFANATETYIERKEDIVPSTIRTLVKGGSVSFILTNDTSLADTAFQTDVLLDTAAGGTANPAIGDIVVQVTRTGTELLSFNIQALYQGVNR